MKYMPVHPNSADFQKRIECDASSGIHTTGSNQRLSRSVIVTKDEVRPMTPTGGCTSTSKIAIKQYIRDAWYSYVQQCQHRGGDRLVRASKPRADISRTASPSGQAPSEPKSYICSALEPSAQLTQHCPGHADFEKIRLNRSRYNRHPLEMIYLRALCRVLRRSIPRPTNNPTTSVHTRAAMVMNYKLYKRGTCP